MLILLVLGGGTTWMDVSIIISYYSGLNILKNCLSQLYKTLKYTKYFYEIIVVNDNPDVKLEKNLQEFSDIKVINHEKNMGHPAACNNGAKIAVGEYLVFMDCDIFVTNNWLEELYQIYKNIPNTGAVSATILNIHTSKIHMTGVAIHQVDMLKILRGSEINEITKDYEYFDFLSSACILIPKEIFNKVKGFDELFFNSDGDLDLTYRIKKQGYQLVTAYKSLVYHKGGVAGTMRRISINDTKAMFFKKWGNDLPDGIYKIEHLYKCFSATHDIADRYLVINLCKSLALNDYIEIIQKSLNTKIIEVYNFKQYYEFSGVSFMDFINNNLVHYNTPFIFLSDNFLCVSNNYFWFKTRECKKDITIDINGNIEFVINVIEN